MTFYHWLGRDAEWFHAVQIPKGRSSFEIEGDGFITVHPRV